MDIQQIQEAGNQARGTTHQFNAEVMESRISDLEAAVAQLNEIVESLSLKAATTNKKS